MEADTCLLKIEKLSKYFGPVHALKNVSFSVQQSEILGLLGDNGAGKSTLIKILTGVYPPTEGIIYFEGKRLNVPSPKEAREQGIETVYQGSPLIELLSIYRNFFLGREIRKKFGFFKVLDKEKMKKESEKVLNDIGVSVRSAEESVSNLSGGERQAVSIGRCMHFGAKLLILDEPLNNLSVKESRVVLKHATDVKRAGVSIIFIDHNIHHVYSVCDRFVILEKGEKIWEGKREEKKIDEIIEIIATGKVEKAAAF